MTRATEKRKKPATTLAPSGSPVEGQLEHASLTKTERTLVAEALRRAEETRNVIEDSLVDFGRWVLVNVFNDDAVVALNPRKENPVWSDLARRAGGPTLGLSRKFLYTAVALAAHDKRISDQSWRLLEPGRKQLLLPLADENEMRRAAQHVVAMKLTQRDTQKYVRARLKERGDKPRLRLTTTLFASHVRKFRERVTSRDYRKKLERTLQAGEASDRTAVREELEALRGWLADVLRAVR